MSRPLLIVGRFPPPMDGQALATRRLADLLEGSFGVRRVNLSTQDTGHVASRVSFSWGKVGHYVEGGRRLRAAAAQAPGAHVVWASISPSLLGHFRDTLAIAPALGKGRRVFAVVFWGSFDRVFRSPLTTWTARRLVRRLTGVVFADPILAARCERWVPPAKRIALPTTIGEDVQCSPQELDAKRDERRGRPTFRLLYLSNMIASKGYGDVLEAARLLDRRGVELEADFVGFWERAEDEQAFDRVVREYGLQHVVRHHGGLRDRRRLKAMHRSADAFVLPTYYPTEAQPISIMEALCAGTPVITTRHASIPGMVAEGVEAHFVPPRDAGAIADAVERLVDFPHWLELSRAARRRFDEQFHPDVVRRRWEDLLA